MQHLSIKKWAIEDRPREKLSIHGVEYLSDAELFAIILGSGTKTDSALDIAKRVLSCVNNNLYELGKLSLQDLTKIKGIGPARAISLIAALEIGRRRSSIEPLKKDIISCSQDVYNIMSPIISEIQFEEFWVLFLSRNNSIIAKHKISKGGISGTVVDVKLIAKKAIELLSAGIILSHNHPSGNNKPSNADIEITKKINSAVSLIDCQVLDHVIIAQKKYYSFADEGIL